jgi:uncharacterized repeat protein (TIGR02543 family)
MAGQAFEYDEEKALTASAFSREGYIFTGWNTKADGTGTSYAPGAQVKDANVNPVATTLYAHWERVEIYSKTNGIPALGIKTWSITSDANGNFNSDSLQSPDDEMFQLSHGEWFKILNARKGSKYTITEESSSQYAPSYRKQITEGLEGNMESEP